MDTKKNEPRMDRPSREAMAGKLQIYADEGAFGVRDAAKACFEVRSTGVNLA